MPESNIITIDPERPEADHIRIGAEKIRGGGVIVFPTQCLYGLGADAFNTDAIDQVFKLKRRPLESPLLILIPSRKDLLNITNHISPAAERIMDIFWPGSVTIIFEANSMLPVGLTAGTGKIGVRLPLHPVAKQLVREAGRPITGTSANISGEPGCKQISEISQSIIRSADLVINAGRLKGGIGSTVVDVTVEPPHILREGIIPVKAIMAAIPGLRQSRASVRNQKATK
ncbi:MAG: L-threonylcarbamoyladenylate synthase [Desulfobacterales bacterium]|jgi:L-threonylcarbamoyladenylate synthase|nr:L-threonylcarbamoyladenylate synthase [Desulfobacterales bacterium]